ncbi:MAG: ribosome maturation factor RimM [Egibacteraceae bacterium]
MGDVAVGVVGKPLGLRGEVYVLADPDLGVEFAPRATFRAGADTLTVATSRLHGNRRVLRFDGVETREAAEALRGRVLTAARDDLDLEPDAFWADELIGLPVVTAAGAQVGTVTGVADGAAHDYLVVADGHGQELLIPAVDQLVDVTPERIVVAPVPGLLGEPGHDAS